MQAHNELFGILKRYGSFLDMQNIDLVQFILFFGKENTQIYRKACSLAERRSLKLSHYANLRLLLWHIIRNIEFVFERLGKI